MSRSGRIRGAQDFAAFFSLPATARMKILLNETQLHEGVRRLADEIDERYGGRPLTIVAVMTGSVVLFADLIRMLSMPLRVGVLQASSYRGEMKPGELDVDTRMLLDVEGRDVLLVDDIFDTGRTLNRLVSVVEQRGATSVRSAVLLKKDREHDVATRPDFVAFEIPDEFVVGYGLDYHDLYRNLPYLAILEADEIAEARESLPVS